MATYDFKTIEAKWQKKWEQDGLFKCNTKSDRPKYYCLMMFPYPSGDLHVGHGRNYIIGDVIVRYRLMRQFEVLSPMGWDAFGLPAENAAIKRNIHPASWTKQNIEKMKTQLKSWGVGYDWKRELATCDPTYYKWTQWIFLELFKRGLAYRKMAPVNWCPECQTVLANDQVVDGKCERCGTETTKRDLEQWFFKITDYAQRLLDDLEKLPKWSQGVIDRQRKRIGRSEGATVFFSVKETGEPLPCYTTRPDTLWGVTYFSVAPEHPICATLKGEAGKQVAEFLERVKKQTNVDRDKIKEGVFTGLHVVNPVNGDAVPLWAANYVLPEYGTGGVMAVPGHDKRDFEFAKKYGLPVKSVIRPADGASLDPKAMTEAFVDDGIMENSAQFSGTPNREGIAKVIAWLEESKKGKKTVNFGLHDWCVSRQRYWGAPIPMVHCGKCGTVPVPDKDLPVLLPEVQDFKPKGRSVLDGVPSFSDTKCPKCGGAAKRDPDTLDTFVDSAWYFLRYLDTNVKDKAFEKAIADKWLAVDQYVGGIEHATGHLLYSRFITKVLKDAGHLSVEEPFQALFTQGMIQMMSYRCAEHVWVPPREAAWAPLASFKATGPKGVAVPFVPGSQAIRGKEKREVATCPKCGRILTAEKKGLSCPEHGGMTGKDATWIDLEAAQIVAANGASTSMLEEHMVGTREASLRDETTSWSVAACPKCGRMLKAENYKMSKTRGNLVPATEMGETWGVDTQRVYTLMVAPADIDAPWLEEGVKGSHKFLRRVWESVHDLAAKLTGLQIEQLDPGALGKAARDLRRKAHETIVKVTDDLDGRFAFHTAISKLIELEHALPDPAQLDKWAANVSDRATILEALEILTVLLAPFAPHIAEELWHGPLAHGGSVFDRAWPEASEHALMKEATEYAIQLNGKVKLKALIPADANTEDRVRELVLDAAEVKSLLGGKAPKMVKVVLGRLVNIVVAG